MLNLIEPSIDREAELQRYIAAFAAAGVTAIDGLGGTPSSSDLRNFIVELQQHARGENLPQGWVPASTYWAIHDTKMVGSINLRHRLTPFLSKVGGHIGYSVHPDYRKRGFATQMLQFGIEKARALGLGKLLITCDKSNVASARVIEKCGGVRTAEVLDGQKAVLQYWIEV
jgi:predicted acetyltransferase